MTKHTDHEINNLTPYTKYKIWVVAYNQNGPGMNSLEVIAVTKPSAPNQPPINIAVEAISSTVHYYTLLDITNRLQIINYIMNFRR